MTKMYDVFLLSDLEKFGKLVAYDGLFEMFSLDWISDCILIRRNICWGKAGSDELTISYRFLRLTIHFRWNKFASIE